MNVQLKPKISTQVFVPIYFSRMYYFYEINMPYAKKKEKHLWYDSHVRFWVFLCRNIMYEYMDVCYIMLCIYIRIYVSKYVCMHNIVFVLTCILCFVCYVSFSIHLCVMLYSFCVWLYGCMYQCIFVLTCISYCYVNVCMWMYVCTTLCSFGIYTYVYPCMMYFCM